MLYYTIVFLFTFQHFVSGLPIGQQETPLVPLNGTCQKDADCGTDAFCDPASNQICRCRLGAINQGDGTNCAPLQCYTQSQCFERFGPGLQCRQGHCACDESFHLNSTVQSCEPVKHALVEECVQNFNCGTNAFCSGESASSSSLANRKCRCRFGYIQSEYNEVNCEPLQCYEDADCVQFSPVAICNAHNCACAPGYVLDPYTQQCNNSKTNTKINYNL